MNISSLSIRPVRPFLIIGALAFALPASPMGPSPAPTGHDGRTTAAPAIIVGSGTNNLRIWSEDPEKRGLNVLLGGLRDYEYFAHVTMIDLRGNTIVDQSVETPNGFLLMELVAETPLPKGIYLLTIRTSDRSWTDRVVMR